MKIIWMMRLRMSLTILWLALGNGGSRSGQRTPHHFTQTHGHSTYYLYLCRRTAKIVVYFIYVGRNKKNVHFTSIFVLMLWFMLVAHWFHALAISSLFIFLIHCSVAVRASTLFFINEASESTTMAFNHYTTHFIFVFLQTWLPFFHRLAEKRRKIMLSL